MKFEAHLPGLIFLLVSALAARADTSINIRAHCAEGDGTTPDTAAIQADLDACRDAGGGQLTLDGQEYTVRFNDEVVTRWKDPKARTSHGFIGLQNYNDKKTVRHRNLRIQELP